MGVSLTAVPFGRAEDSVSSVIFFLSIYALTHIGFFISWRCVPDSEIEGLPEPDPKTRRDALEYLEKNRFSR